MWGIRAWRHTAHSHPSPQGTPTALERKGPQRRPQKRLDGRLQEVAKAVGGGYCQLQMPLKPALGVRGTVAGHRLGALGGGFPMHPCPMASGPAAHAAPCKAGVLQKLQA